MRNTQKVRVPHSMDVQDPTLRFFLEGDELEAETRRAALERARGVENDNGEREARTRDTLILRDRDLGSLNPYERFENHARTRGALIGLAMLSSMAAMGVAGWMWMTSPTRPGLDWVQQRAIPAVRSLAGSLGAAPAAPTAEHAAEGAPVTAAAESTPPAPTPTAPMTAPTPTAVAAGPAPTAAAGEPAPTAAPAVAVLPAAAPTAAPVVEPIPAAAPTPSAVAAVASPAADTREQEPASRSSAPSGEGKALRGYVWSPAAKTLVTSTAAPEVTAPKPTTTENVPVAKTDVAKVEDAPAVPSNPDAPMPSSLLSGPGIAAPTTGPAPDETARVPSTEPTPFPAPALPDNKGASAAKSAAPIIE